MEKDGDVVGFHNGDCGGEVRISSGSKRSVTMGTVGGKTAVMHCLECKRVVPDKELVKK